MRVKQFGLAALFAVAGAAVAIGVAPIAVADECDPQPPSARARTSRAPTRITEFRACTH